MEIQEYHPGPDGQMRDVDELRDLCHELSCALGSLLNHPGVRMNLEPMQYMILSAAAEAAHSMVCPKIAEASAPQTVEGSLGTPNILSDDDLRELFKNFD